MVLGGLVAVRGGFGARFGGGDLYAAFLPKYRAAADALAAGRAPLWNPEEYCGLPLLGTAQGAVLYPPVVVASTLVTDEHRALQVLYHAHLFALVLLTLAYLAHAGIGPAGGTVAAVMVVASIFNGAAFAGRDHPSFLFCLVYVPAVLLGWQRLRSGSASAAVLLAVGCALQWLAGYPEFAMDTGLLLALVVGLGVPAPRPRELALVAALVGGGALLAAPQILALAETVSESVRGGEFQSYVPIFQVFGPGYFVSSLLQRLSAGGVVLLLSAAATEGWVRRAWLAAFLWALFVANWPLSLLYRVYPFSGARSAFGWHHLWPVFAAYLAGAGVEQLRTPGRATTVPTLLAAALALAALAVGRPVDAALSGACSLALLPALRRRGGWLLPPALVAAHAAGILWSVPVGWGHARPDLSAMASPVATMRAARAELPGDPRVVAGPELRAGIPLRAGLPSPAGHEPALAPRRVLALLAPVRLGALATGWFEAQMWRSVAAAPNVAAMLGVGLAAVPSGFAPILLDAGYVEIRRLPDDRRLLYRAAVPRAHVVHTARSAASEAESLALVTASDFDPWREVVLEGEVGASPAERVDTEGSETARIVVDGAERVVVEATLTRAGHLVLADTFFPGWRATVDGAPVALWRANHAFRAVALPAGAHRVEMIYAPRSWRLGLVLVACGVLVVATCSVAAQGLRPWSAGGGTAAARHPSGAACR